MADIKLGLIGDQIERSRAPVLHRLAGRLCGLEVSYDLLVPRELGLDLAAVLARCAATGYRGVNVTHPYKETVAAKVAVDEPLIRAIGAVNTVVFEPDGPKGFNSDHSGFIAAYREAFGTRAPGPVCMIGAGGVGRAIGFALIELGLEEIRIVERDPAKAEALAGALRAARAGLRATVAESAAESVAAAVAEAEGLVNSTPIGMYGHDGTPIAKELMAGARWAFDSVYTPVDTGFLRHARAAGIEALSGYELFFHQGVDAFRIFCGREVDRSALRARLQRATA